MSCSLRGRSDWLHSSPKSNGRERSIRRRRRGLNVKVKRKRLLKLSKGLRNRPKEIRRLH